MYRPVNSMFPFFGSNENSKQVYYSISTHRIMATISFHVSYGEKEKIVKVENQDELKGRIVKTFGLRDDAQLKLQLYCKEWDDWVYTDFEDELAQEGKLKVVGKMLMWFRLLKSQ